MASGSLGRFGRYLAAIILLPAAIAAARLPVRTYTVDDGLALNAVYKIRQDSYGFMWFCTGDGVSRFDGFEIVNFGSDDGLPGGRVNDLLQTRDGVIYVATEAGGLMRLNPYGFRKSAANPIFRSVGMAGRDDVPRTIKVLYEDAADGTLYIGTAAGLYRLRTSDESWEKVVLSDHADERESAETEVVVSSIIKDRRGRFWIGSNRGLFRLDSAGTGSVDKFGVANGLPKGAGGVASVFEDPDGRIWAGMAAPAAAGLVLLNADAEPGGTIAARTFSVEDGFLSSWVPSMLTTANDGKFWLATSAGLCEWREGERGADDKRVCRSYRKKEKLCDYDVWSLAEDRDGNLWVGSGCGASRISRHGFVSFDESDGIKAEKPETMFRDADNLYLSFIDDDSREIVRYANSRFTRVKPHTPADEAYLGWASGERLFRDSTGAWLMSTERGLFKFPRDAAFEQLGRIVPRNVTPPELLRRDPSIYRFYEDSRGDYWIAAGSSSSELWQWQRATGEWVDRTAELDRSQSRFVTAFAESGSSEDVSGGHGRLWIATGSNDGAGQILSYRDGKFTSYGAGSNLGADWYRDALVDHRGRLWLANSRGGVYRLDDAASETAPKFVRYSLAEGLSSSGAICLTEDAFGRIYIGGPRGIDRLDPESGQVESFTTADGLPSSVVEMALRDGDDNLWFATGDGVARFSPEPARPKIGPAVFVREVTTGGEPQRVSVLGETNVGRFALDADHRQVSVEFAGVGASLGERLSYEYRIWSGNDEPSGGGWKQTTERSVNFANLSAGDYRFEVRAISANFVVSPAPAVVLFSIASPFYRQTWFVLLTMLAVALVGYSFYRYRLGRLLEIERTRTRIATDLHDDIGTNLSKISMLSEVANLQLERDGAGIGSRQLLGSIAEIARESVDSMSDIVWAINPRRDSLLDLVRRMRIHVEELFLDGPRDVEIAMNLPADDSADSLKLSMDARRELFLVFKEAVNNTARHADCTRIAIDLRAEGRWIRLVVSDNGKGFDESCASPGNGLANMRQRVRKYGGEFSLTTAPLRGTSITITFPQT